MDASALVAILNTEPGFEQYSARASRADQLYTSGLARWETIRAMTRERQFILEQASSAFDQLLQTFEIKTVAIGEVETVLAIQAHNRYGKGNHEAKLNMGDCFAYACAKAHGAKLLYKRDDFARTDMA
jgi:ribonuclease VapC